MTYAAFADRLFQTGVVPDPWVDDRPRFDPEPVVLSATTRDRLYAAAEAVARTLDGVVRLALADEDLLDATFALTPTQRALALAAGPHWHGHARADVFVLADGTVRVCELNSDTPTGHAEAWAANRVAHADRPHTLDPTAGLPDAFARIVRARAPAGARRVGLLYGTELTEDLHVVRLFQAWLEADGWEVVLGSPFNLTPRPDGGLALAGRPIDVLLRHYRADWWTERTTAVRDAAPFEDTEPLPQLAWVVDAEARGRVCVVNPFGALLAQSKRALTVPWEHPHRLAAPDVAAFRAVVPETVRLESVSRACLLREQHRWVLKSDYGAEGEEVLLGARAPSIRWAAALDAVTPERWVVQRAFDATDARGYALNHGVFVFGGVARGLYGRWHRGADDADALSVPILVAP